MPDTSEPERSVPTGTGRARSPRVAVPFGLPSSIGRSEHDRFYALLMQAPALIAVLRGPEHVYDFANLAYRHLLHDRDLLGKPIRQVVPELEEEGVVALLDHVYASGERHVAHEVPLVLDLRGDGRAETLYLNWVLEAVRGPDGAIEGVFAHVVDVTDQVRARQEVQELASAMAAEHERFALAQEAARTGAFEWDVETGQVTWTPELQELFGLPPGSFGGTIAAWLALVHPEDRAPAEATARRAVTEGGSLQFDYRVVRPDGAVRIHEARARVIRDGAGRTPRLIGICMDVTESTQAAAALRQYTETLELVSHTSQILSAELDLRKLIQAVTDATTEATGAAHGAFFYNTMNERGETHQLYAVAGASMDAYADLPIPHLSELTAQAFSGQGVIRVADVSRDPRFGQRPPYYGPPPGHPAIGSYLAVPVVSRSGEVLGGLLLGHPEPGVFTAQAAEIAAGLAAQAAIAIENARLYRAAQDSIRIRDEFLTSAAHDLKTPLAGIKGLAQLLQRRVNRMSAPEVRRLAEGLSSINEITTRMTAQVNELLDFTQLQLNRSLQLDRRPTNLVRLVQRAAAAACQASDRHRVRVETPQRPVIGLWDASRLERMLDNLLSNALRYSPEGGTVTVRLRRESIETSPWAVLQVEDEGIGIPAADLTRVFERFARGANVVGRIGGTGIGLASTRSIVESHGGSIAVESREGAGSTFTVRLPLAPPRERP